MTAGRVPADPAAGAAGLSRPTRRELFVGFLLLGLTGFGGVLPLARDALVVRRRWLSEAEFVDLLGLCQLLPGGNILNLSFAVGMYFRGVPGALAAFTGLLAAPAAIVILLGTIYEHVRHAPLVGHLLAGLAAAAAGLLFAMTIQLGMRLRGDAAGLAVAAAAFVAVALLRLPLVPALAALLGISVAAVAIRRT